MKRETRIHDSQDESFFQSEDIDSAQIGFSDSVNANKKPSLRFEDAKIYEITLDIHGETPATALATHTTNKDSNRKTGTERVSKGLQFVTQGVSKKGWAGVKAKFNDLAEDGFLPRSKFGQCIGMTGSDEFAGHLFDTLARRIGVVSSSVTEDQLQELWGLLSNESFVKGLQTFFDMVDKNADGRITEEEVKELEIAMHYQYKIA